jgi:hypothetical protein
MQANFISSDGWKFINPSGIQREEPFTDFPTPGIKTKINKKIVKRKISGAKRSQTFVGI